MDPFLIFASLFPVFFLLIAGIVTATFVVVLVRSIGAWHKNNNAPRLTVEAVVVAKRTSVAHHHSEGHYHSNAWYYATFEVESGDRLELPLPGREYGLLAEGDWGRLTFQGSRFLAFCRAPRPAGV